MKKSARRASPKKSRTASRPGDSKLKRKFVRLNVLPHQLWLTVPKGTTIWEALQPTDVDMDGDCGGLGKCGKCKVKVVSAIGRPTKEETELLTPTELAQGIRLACRNRIKRDMQIDVGDPLPAPEHNQILKTGHRTIIQLDPLVDKRVVTSAPELRRQGVSDFDRLKLALGPEYSDITASLDCMRKLPGILGDDAFEGAAVIHRDRVLDVQPWDKVGRRYGLAFDLGTSTLVGKLIRLLDGREVAAVSCLNGQIRYGSDVISRLQFIKDERTGLDQLRGLIVRDLNRIVRALLKVGRIRSDEIFVAVAAGNTTMQHIFLGLPPLGIAKAPFTPVVTDGVVAPAKEVGLDINPEAVVYVMPTRSGYIGGDTIGVIMASGAAEQDREMVLGLDLGTNGEIFLGNSKRLLTCSAAAGPALEGARISSGMIARTGAIEAVRMDDGEIYYRVIGNTKPKGMCGSGLVDLVAVLLHAGIIDSEGLIVPLNGQEPSGLRSRVAPNGEVCDFVIAWPPESSSDAAVYLTQKDVRELQLAKGAIAAGIRTLVDEMGVSVQDIDRVCLAGALGNYVDVLSAMRIGLLPRVNPDIVVSLGNAASMGASMVLLSREYWSKANELSDSVEHVELSSRLDFNGYFVENIDFPQYNLW